MGRGSENKIILKQGMHYQYAIADIKTPLPSLRIIFLPAMVNYLRRQLVNYDIDGLYIQYTIHSPDAYGEYDAARFAGATYTGLWREEGSESLYLVPASKP